MGWGEKSEIIILLLAPASIRAVYSRYSDFTSHQYKSRVAPLKSVKLLWIYAELLQSALGSRTCRRQPVTCPAQRFSLQKSPVINAAASCAYQKWASLRRSLFMVFDYFLQFAGLGHRTPFSDT